MEEWLQEEVTEFIDQLVAIPATDRRGQWQGIAREFGIAAVLVPADWTVGRTLQHIREVERSRETVYAIYVLDPQTRQLQQVRADCPQHPSTIVVTGRRRCRSRYTQQGPVERQNPSQDS